MKAIDPHKILRRCPESLPLPAVFDGATGTTLMKLGMPKGVCAEKWSAEHPEAVAIMHRGYIDAGSDIICTPTFGANPPTLLRHGVTDAYSLNKTLCAMSSPVRESGRMLAANLSPTGLFIEPYGETPFEEVVNAYAEQARGQSDGGVDVFYTETNISLNEARAAVFGVRQVSDKPVFASVTIGENGRTLSGETPLCCFLTLAAAGACAVGTNCSTGPDAMRKFLAPLMPYSVALGVPVIGKPNAGVPKTEGGERISRDEFLEGIRAMLLEGIAIVGGCCGSDADYIRGIRSLADEYKPDFGEILSGIAPADVNGLACSGSEICLIDPALAGKLAKRPTDSDFEDIVYDGEEPFLAARLEDDGDADALSELMSATKKPLALTGDKGDSGAVKRFCRTYCGAPFIF